jgi:hypothetical protein
MRRNNHLDWRWRATSTGGSANPSEAKVSCRSRQVWRTSVAPAIAPAKLPAGMQRGQDGRRDDHTVIVSSAGRHLFPDRSNAG